MPEGPDGQSGSPSSGMSLVDFLSSTLDGGVTEEGPESSTAPEQASPDAGAQPASQASAPSEEKPEGSDAPQPDAERAGAQPADAAPAGADAAVPSKDSDDDPLKDATPFTYIVNGQERTAEGIKRLGAHGAIVEPDYLDKLASRFSERDQLYEADRVNRQKLQEFERLTEWRTKDEKTGAETVLNGARGIEAQRVQAGRALAALSTITAAFQQSPMALIAQDAEGNVVWDQVALQHLITRSELGEMRAEQAVKHHLSTLAQSVQETATRQATDAELPGKLWAAAETQWAAQHPELTPEDKNFLASQVPRYMRQATPEEHRAGLGTVVLDPSFYAVIKDRAELRASAATSAKTAADAATKATRENAARLAAAAQGAKRTTQPLRPSAPVKQPTPAQQRASDSEQAWALRERASNGQFTAGST